MKPCLAIFILWQVLTYLSFSFPVWEMVIIYRLHKILVNIKEDSVFDVSGSEAHVVSAQYLFPSYLSSSPSVPSLAFVLCWTQWEVLLISNCGKIQVR